MAYVPFSSEIELQIACAHSPTAVLAATGNLVERAIAIPREFRVGINPIDCAYVTNTGRFVLVECKLSENPDFRGRIIGQILGYCTAIQNLPALRLRGDLIYYYDRYNLRWKEQLKNELGIGSVDDDFWISVDGSIKANQMEIIVVTDWYSREIKLALDAIRAALPQTVTVSVAISHKDQEHDYLSPSYSFHCPARYTAPTLQMPYWTPLRTKRWRIDDLPKKQPRVKLVGPPDHLFVEDSLTWSRNAKIEENHVVDPARSASLIPVMPNINMLNRTGSPYPSMDWHPTIEPLPSHYRPWAELGRCVWKLIERKKKFNYPEDGESVLREARVKSKTFADHSLSESYGMTGVLSALRDMCLFGVGKLYHRPDRRWQFILS